MCYQSGVKTRCEFLKFMVHTTVTGNILYSAGVGVIGFLPHIVHNQVLTDIGRHGVVPIVTGAVYILWFI